MRWRERSDEMTKRARTESRRWRGVARQVDTLDVAVFDAVAHTSSPLLDATMPRLTRAADRSVLWIAIAGSLALSRRPRARGGRAGTRLDRRHEPRGQPGLQASAPPTPSLDHAGTRAAPGASHPDLDVVPERAFRQRDGFRRGRVGRMACAVRSAAGARRTRRILPRRDGRALSGRCRRRLRSR